jgi:hypothetical protein
MWFADKNNIVRGLVGGNNNIFFMEERQVFIATFGSSMIDVEQVLIDNSV